MIPATQTNNLKTKIWNELKIMLPYHELTFSIACKEKLTSIRLQMRGKAITIKKGNMRFCNYTDKVKQCLVNIYKEFEEEIQALFEMDA